MLVGTPLTAGEWSLPHSTGRLSGPGVAYGRFFTKSARNDSYQGQVMTGKLEPLPWDERRSRAARLHCGWSAATRRLFTHP